MGLKKILRKVGKGVRKAAPIAMLALGAAALAKRRKAKALNAITDYGDTGPLSGKAGYEGNVPSASKVDIVPKKKPRVNPAEWLIGVGDDPVIPGIQAGAKKGGRAGKDFGKRGAGCAKRGFGRALRKK